MQVQLFYNEINSVNYAMNDCLIDNVKFLELSEVLWNMEIGKLIKLKGIAGGFALFGGFAGWAG